MRIPSSAIKIFFLVHCSSFFVLTFLFLLLCFYFFVLTSSFFLITSFCQVHPAVCIRAQTASSAAHVFYTKNREYGFNRALRPRFCSSLFSGPFLFSGSFLPRVRARIKSAMEGPHQKSPSLLPGCRMQKNSLHGQFRDPGTPGHLKAERQNPGPPHKEAPVLAQEMPEHSKAEKQTPGPLHKTARLFSLQKELYPES